MDTLTSKTISREIAKCVSRERYHLWIILNTRNDALQYCEKLLSEIRPFQDVWQHFENAKHRQTQQNISIELQNGSLILFNGVPNEAFRGRRFHKILIDNDVPLPINDPRMVMLRAMETLEYYEQERRIARNAANWIF